MWKAAYISSGKQFSKWVVQKILPLSFSGRKMQNSFGENTKSHQLSVSDLLCQFFQFPDSSDVLRTTGKKTSYGTQGGRRSSTFF
jgi:hypothetical protein